MVLFHLKLLRLFKCLGLYIGFLVLDYIYTYILEALLTNITTHIDYIRVKNLHSISGY